MKVPLFRCLFLAGCLCLFSLHSYAQLLDPQSEPPKVSQAERSREEILSITALIHKFDKSLKVYKKDCNFYQQYGAPPFDESTNQFLNKIIPQAKVDFQSCAKRKTGNIFSEQELDSYVKANYENGTESLLLNMLGTSPKPMPTNKLEVKKGWESCQYLILATKQQFDGIKTALGYPNQGWCEKLAK